jgi:tetratricopeptide (TPR) repeat protein
MTTPAQELFYEGNRQLKSGKLTVAEQCFRNAINLNPEFSEAWANLGHVRSKAGDTSFAEQCYLKAISFNPELEPAFLMFGVLLMNQKRFDESEQLYRGYLRRHPDSAPIWSNLGVLLACLKRETEAEQCYRTALIIDDSFTKASFNLSYILLRQKRWEEGWRRLEDRWQYPILEKHFTFPRWRGEPLFGKSFMIGFEMGHGDMIFYSRYIAELKARGVRQVAMICHPGLKKIFACLEGVDQLYSLDDEVPPDRWDYWSPPMSLPHYCLTTTDSIPVAIPYLQADPVLVDQWSDKLPINGIRVGLVWKGNPLFENDADRSIPSLQEFAPLADIPGVHYIGLQKGPGETERPPLGMTWLGIGPQLNDFADTAAVIQNLDLVISVDTAVAHLAGAMGKPCWVLLPDFRCDWRWQAEGDVTPWYPNGVRLFRQPAGGGWHEVIGAVRDALIRHPSYTVLSID